MFTFDGRSLGVDKWGVLFGWHFLIWSLKGSCCLGGSAMAGMHGSDCEESCRMSGALSQMQQSTKSNIKVFYFTLELLVLFIQLLVYWVLFVNVKIN